MTDPENIHVVSTTNSTVWLVAADNADDAVDAIQTDYAPGANATFYEGTLDTCLHSVDRDGVALVNP